MSCFAIVGPTGIGKTMTLMTSLSRPFLCRNLNDLKYFTTRDYDCIIFDDMTFENISRAETVIHLLDPDYPSSIRILRMVVHLDPHVIKFFTHNDESFIRPIIASENQIAAINRRIKVTKVNSREEIIEWINRIPIPGKLLLTKK